MHDPCIVLSCLSVWFHACQNYVVVIYHVHVRTMQCNAIRAHYKAATYTFHIWNNISLIGQSQSSNRPIYLLHRPYSMWVRKHCPEQQYVVCSIESHYKQYICNESTLSILAWLSVRLGQECFQNDFRYYGAVGIRLKQIISQHLDYW